MRGPFKLQALDVIKTRGIPVGTILDVGVLEGTPELKKIFPDKMHVLFEPVREFHEKIADNYRSAGIQFDIVGAAVADCDGEVDLQVVGKFGEMEISHSFMVLDADSKEDKSTRRVKRVSLDSFLSDKSYDWPYLLKIDIDGHDELVLNGAKETLKKTSVIIIEATAKNIAKRIEMCLEAGFRVFDLCEPCYYDGVFWQCDIIAIRQELYRDLFLQMGGGRVVADKYQIFVGS